MPTTSSSPRLDALLLLDAYQAAHQQGDSDLKASLWSLTKARREKPGISAVDIREELESTLQMEQVMTAKESEEEPELKHERFSVLDVTQKQLHEKENVSSPAVPNAATNDKSTGLRNRHSKTDYSSSKNDDDNKPSMTREDKIHDAPVVPDPLQLLGGAFPPRSLVTSQAQAKQAIESYIRAANLIHELLLVMKETKK